MRPLEGIRVVALEQAVAAPLCTKHLADLGASVLKVERPGGGDFARQYDTVVLGESAYFVWLNQGKQSLELDIKDARGRRMLGELLDGADVFVHNLAPGSLERTGLGWRTVHRKWPRLIVCSISGFGVSGPDSGRKAFDLLLQAESGLMSITGSDEAPARVGISIADISAGMYALSSVLAALQLRERTGTGTLIDISMLECLAEWLAAPLFHQLYGKPPIRSGMKHNMIAPYGAYHTADGVVMVAVQTDQQWERFCRGVLGDPSLIRDPMFASNELRVSNSSALDSHINAAFGGQSRVAVLDLLQAADLPTSPLNSLAELAEHRQLAARDRWRTIKTPAGSVRSLRPPFNIEGMDASDASVPALDNHRSTG